MATYRIVAWKDIPAMVEASDAADAVSVPLSDKFQALIDSVAAQQGLHAEDDYLAHWSRSEPQDRPGSARDVGAAVAAELEARFPEFIARAFGGPP
ncbi:MAG TPA: virulence factor [Candidatus Tectomicrobia bacterium]|nr:virulence factor [Candidatus Tectomicrobia bacterium]